jgi:hypothetical protein
MDYISTGDSTIVCDNCGRPIPLGKGYLFINGWYICGICQWKNGNIPSEDLSKNKKYDSSDNYSIA